MTGNVWLDMIMFGVLMFVISGSRTFWYGLSVWEAMRGTLIVILLWATFLFNREHPIKNFILYAITIIMSYLGAKIGYYAKNRKT